MARYPKLPYGPSAPGSAGARAINARGGKFQTKRIGTEAIAKRSGDFSEVIALGEPRYVTRDDGNTGARKLFDTEEFRRPFSKSRLSVFGAHVGGRVYVESRKGDSGVTSITAYTPVWPAELTLMTPAGYSHDVLSVIGRTTTIAAGGYDYSPRGLAEIPITYCYQTYNSAPLQAIETPAVVTKGIGKVLAVIPTLTGRTHPDDGHPLCDLALYETDTNADTSVSVLPVDRAAMSFHPQAHAEVTGGKAFILAGEMGFAHGLPGAPYDVPRLLMYVMDLESGVLDLHDLSNVLAACGLVFSPATSYAWNGTYPDSDPANQVAFWHPYSLATHWGAMRQLFQGLRCVAMSRTELLYVTRHAQTGMLIFKVTGGASPTATVTYMDSTTNPTPQADGWRVQSVVHLGAGKVLLKRARNPAGGGNADFTIEFMYSGDFGTTWVSRPPVGFEAPSGAVPSEHEAYYGELIVDTPATEDRDGVVLITSWCYPKRAYHLYSSKDGGASWRRRGRIAKAAEFRAITGTRQLVDVPVQDGNFKELIRGPSYTRGLDITVPKRYAKE